MPDYKNGKIYKIESFEGECQYIGSTCQKLSMRMAGHRRDKKKKTRSGDVLKYEDAKIYLILNYPCNNKEELLSKEAEYIRQLDCVNKQIPLRTLKEYYIDNKDRICEKVKQYNNDNKEIISKKKKQYRIDNKEILSNKSKIYRVKNKEILKEKAKIKYTCECGSIITKSNKSQHINTKKHLNFITENP